MYLSIKAIHIIAVISWMAGMLYLPRLFVYHSAVETTSSEARLFELMEYRLMRFIMLPALGVVWLSGGYLAFSGAFLFDVWMQVKFLIVVAMSGVHGYFSLLRKNFISGTNNRSQKFFRWLNELPTLLMVVIVFLVVLKPL
jgi:putative membrane protein